MYYVYILSSINRTIYIGVTNDIQRRTGEHKNGTTHFTNKYNVHRLVHVETFSDVTEAIQREKQLKGWTRKKKIALIEENNPDWNDLTIT